LKDKRLYPDLVEVYKITNRISCRDPQGYTRLTSYSNIITERCNLDVGLNFFSQRVAQPWNELPIEIKDSPNIGCFKARLKRYMLSLHSGHIDANHER